MPPSGVVVLSRFWESGPVIVPDGETFADVFAATNASASWSGDFAPFVSGAVANGQKFNIGGRSLQLDRTQFKLAGHCGSCHLKALLSLVTRNFFDSTEVSREDLDNLFDLTPTDGICLPVGFDIDDPLTWFLSDIFEPDAPEPPDPDTDEETDYTKLLEDFRWIGIEGYDPPTDGSANGFPIV